MLPYNTSSLSNTLGASDRAAQRKALISSFNQHEDHNASLPRTS
jgi:hypothetical protein